ncbi:MAG: rhodanese-like domain-containing protein [Armatimonadota bacterium]
MHRAVSVILVINAVVASSLLVGCGGSSTPVLDPTTVQNISGAELEAMMGGADPLVILDVRGSAEFSASHIPGAVNIPLHELRQRLDELDPRVPVACVCSAGFRSIQGAQMLTEAGFSTVFNLEGGLGNWPGEWETDCPTCY